MLKKDFPIFKEGFTYLDSAASTQKPKCVLGAVNDFYTHFYANVHKGTCQAALKATQAFEDARQMVADFLHTESKNIVFTHGATDSINLVASGIKASLKPGDEVLVSVAEHHANFVPWQQICAMTGATFKVFRVLDSGAWDLEDFNQKLTSKTKMVAVAQVSNVLGIKNPVDYVIQRAHKQGALVLIDGAQSAAHMPVNVQKMGCDFFVLSGHKMYGPTGVGILYGRTEALNALPPYQFGGDMIKEVAIDHTTFQDGPARFEAGTPSFVGAYGLGVALKYLQHIGMEKLEAHEEKLTKIIAKEFKSRPWVKPLGDMSLKQGIVAFTVVDIPPEDMTFFLAKYNVCLRTGHHCAMPLHTYFKTPHTLRISLGLYNDTKDIKDFMGALDRAYALIKGAL